MFKSFSNSWELVKASYEVLRSDRELLLFPLISMAGVFIVMLVFFVPVVLSGLLAQVAQGGSLSGAQTTFGWVLLFLFYVVMYTVIIFSNVALVGAALMRLRGENPTLADGFRIAREHLSAIVGYAVISATVGIVLSLLRDRNGIIGRIIASVINVAWNVVTFLAVPVLVVEGVGPIEAIKRSGALLKKTWGEQVVANGGIGLVFFLLMLLAVIVVGGPIFLLGSALNSAFLIVLAVLLSVFLVALLGLFSSALNTVFQAALYNYATTQKIDASFRYDLITEAFKSKRR